jgi:hypothetical protein
LIANTIAYALRLFDQIVEEPAHVVGDAVDDREHLFEHVANEIRGRNPKVLGESADIVGELLGNPGMKDPLLATLVAAFPATPASPPTVAVLPIVQGVIGVEIVSYHGSQCDSS